jgi:hypothetical protein
LRVADWGFRERKREFQISNLRFEILGSGTDGTRGTNETKARDETNGRQEMIERDRANGRHGTRRMGLAKRTQDGVGKFLVGNCLNGRGFLGSARRLFEWQGFFAVLGWICLNGRGFERMELICLTRKTRNLRKRRKSMGRLVRSEGTRYLVPYGFCRTRNWIGESGGWRGIRRGRRG